MLTKVYCVNSCYSSPIRARSAAVCLRSKYKSMSKIATKSGESWQAVYRLLSLSTKRRVKKEYVRKLKPEERDEVL